MIALMILTPIVFNFRNFFNIGVFNVEDDYYNTYSDGTAGINLHMRLNHHLDYQYYLDTFIEPISTNEVENYGLLSITIFYFNDNQQIVTSMTTTQFDTPVNSNYPMDRIFVRSLTKNSNLTCYGVIEFSLESEGSPINDTINFQLTYIFPVGIDFYHNLDLVLYVLFFLQFFLYVIIPVTLNWIFKPIFGLNLSEEDTKRDEKFVHFLQNQARIKKEESKIDAAKKKNDIT